VLAGFVNLQEYQARKRFKKKKVRAAGLSEAGASYNQTVMHKGKSHYQCKLDPERNFAHYR